MTKNKSTKKAFLASLLSLMLCLVMLIGTTFAWFTDSVTSGKNQIVSGNLDIELDYWDGKEWKTVKDASNIFDANALWEPGYTEVVYLKLTNKGNLDLKYQFGMNIISEKTGINQDGETFKLSDYIEFGVVEDINGETAAYRQRSDARAAVTDAKIISEGYSKAGNMTEKEQVEYLAFVVYMPEETGNVANHDGTEAGIPKIELGLKVVATQLMNEEDSFGNDYDEEAFYYDALVDSDAELKEAIVGQKKVIAIDGNLTYDWGRDSYENSKALLLNGLTLTGWNGDDSITFAGYGSANPIVGATIKNITVKDVTVGDKESAWEHGHLELVDATIDNVVFDCTIMTDGDTVITNSVVNNATPSWYSLWVEGGNTTIKNTTFTGTRAVKIHEAYGTEVESVLIDNCTFKELNEKPGVVIGDLNADTKVTIQNSNFVNCQAGDQGKYIYESDTDVTSFNFVEENNVITNKTIVKVNDAATLETALTGAGQAGSGNTYIEFSGDNIDLTGTTWTPVKVDGYHGADIVTIDGNGATITGLSAPLFAGGFAGGSGIVIKNLTIADSSIISTNTIGSGAFIESVDSMDVITLENCHLLNSTVTGGDGSRTGGLIGWTAGYNNVNDGPVKTYVTITDCSVIGCTITCDGSVGAIYGHAGNNAWTYSTVEDCVVKDNKLNSTDDGGWRVGVVVGTANVGEMTINNITESGNTLTQTGKTAPVGQSNLYGRFVPNDTGKLVIDGVEIK